MVATLSFRLEVTDLSATSFACSPLTEAVLSLRTWVNPPAKYPWHQAWLRHMRPKLQELDVELLRSLIAPPGYSPDCLTPRPTRPWTGFTEGLDIVRNTPPDIVQRDIEIAYRSAGYPLPRVLREAIRQPDELLQRITSALQQYWSRCLEPAWWPRARSVLAADIVHRARTLAERGADGLFADLDPRISWRDGILTIRDENLRPDFFDSCSGLVEVGGRGLVLNPSLFARGAFPEIIPDGPPVIAYPARGRGDMAEYSVAEGSPTLRKLLGAARAQLLVLLSEPVTTSGLAQRLGVTPGAVSQHLSILLAAGLVTRARHGRNVLYERTPLGTQLCQPDTWPRKGQG
ncbi:ArsR family transcriptional regulator [Streptomyces sp. NPDC020362]|uniref:ArsR/SmtB family transcription factor n=1 Tax=Streptomyces sp. NPDC020362 TaxID=3154486 RepID=UPI0033FAC56A